MLAWTSCWINNPVTSNLRCHEPCILWHHWVNTKLKICFKFYIIRAWLWLALGCAINVMKQLISTANWLRISSEWKMQIVSYGNLHNPAWVTWNLNHLQSTTELTPCGLVLLYVINDPIGIVFSNDQLSDQRQVTPETNETWVWFKTHFTEMNNLKFKYFHW